VSKAILIFLGVVVLALSGCNQNTASSAVAGRCNPIESLLGQAVLEPLTFTYRTINSYDHDPLAFTQGLIYHEGELYEGTGLWGESTLRRVALESGEVLQKISIDDQFFGEGVTLWNDQLIQLTWRSNVGFVYDRATFDQQAEFSYPTEGWGITHDGERLIMSDGSANLYFLDPETFVEIGRIEVTDGARAINNLNELEFINGEVFANVWQTNRIARIDPGTGNVLGWIDLTGLLPLADRTGREDVLNGIAYDAGCGRLFVTGKLWPKLFEVELIQK